MNKDDAMKLALEALEGMYIQGFTQDDSPINNAITALRKALAEQPAQRTWVGLTDEEIYMHCPNWLSQEQCKAWIQQVEAKLKEKNNG